MKDSASQINTAIVGFTDVVELTISQTVESSYDLTVVLANSDLAVVKLECFEVSNLAIAKFGDGLTQFLCLRAEDVSAPHLDKVSLRFTDLEQDAIAFDCSSACVSSVRIS